MKKKKTNSFYQHSSICHHFISTLAPRKVNPSQSWILDSIYWIPDSLSVELRIRDSNRWWDSGFRELLSGFHRPSDSQFQRSKFLGFRNPGYLKWAAIHFNRLTQKE